MSHTKKLIGVALPLGIINEPVTLDYIKKEGLRERKMRYKGLEAYFHFRNKERPQEAPGYKIPWDGYIPSSLFVP